MVETGVKTIFDKDTVLFLKSRSGLTFKNKIDTVAGVIDSDYKDTIKVILSNRNHTSDLFNIKKGDRISQGVFLKLSMDYYPDAVTPNNRNGGFGSTGTN